jgi:hypothetical protein
LPREKLPSPQPEEQFTSRQQHEARVTQLFIEHKVFTKDFIETKVRELDNDGLLMWEEWLTGQIKFREETRSESA